MKLPRKTKNKRLTKKKYAKQTILVGAFLFLVVLGVAFLYDFLTYFDLDKLEEHRDILMTFTEQKPVLVWVMLFVSYASMTAVSIPGMLFFTMMAGFLLGFWQGILLVSVSTTLGCLFAFLFFRAVTRNFVVDQIPEKYEYIFDEIYDHAPAYLFAMRMIPILPFIVPNFIMSLTDIKPIKYLIVSYIGIIPLSVFSVNAGLQLSRVSSWQDLFSLKIFLSFIIIGVFPLLGSKLLKLFHNKHITTTEESSV